MFTEGQYDKAAAPNITLGQARDRLLTMLNAPNINCETCGQIRIQPDDSPTNSSDPGAILKVDVRSANNCVEKCVGPNSFSEAQTSPSPTASKSAASQLVPKGGWHVPATLASVVVAWMMGIVAFGIVTIG